MARVPSGEGRIAAEMAQLARAQTTTPSAGVAPSTSGGLSWTPAGGGQFIGGTPTNVPGGTSQPGAPRPAVPQGRREEETPTGPTGPTGPTIPVGPSAEELYYEWLKKQAREGARAFLRGLLETYGLGSLAGRIEELIGDSTNELVIAERLRQTPEYRTRFKGLVNLREKGVVDIRDEAEYLRFESSYRKIFRDNDLQSYLGTPGSQQEIDKIASLVGDFSLSVDEVEERVIDARRVVADTAPEVRESLQRFYNITPDLMVEFVLDPENTSEVIQRRANAAVVGGYAQRAGLEFGAGVAERIGSFLGGERDIQGTQIEPQLTQISDIQRTTQRLAEIEQGTLSAETSALAALDLDREARERVRTLQSRERARFGGRSGITTGTLSAGPSV